MSLHVVQLGPVPPPEGGITRNIDSIRASLVARGDRCSLVATSASEQTESLPGVYFPRSAAALISTVRELRPDVLHLHVGGDLTNRVKALALVSTFLARRTVLSIHSGAYPLTEEAKRASTNSFLGRIFRRFSRVIVVNDALADVMRRFGVHDSRLRVILPYSLSRPDDSVSIPPNLESFVARHSPLLLSVGGLEADYDPQYQIQALSAILAEYPNAGLLVAGSGSMRDAVEATVSDCGYSDKVLLAGNVDHSAILHLIRRADVLLRTTLFDGDSISVREALFLGTPVIATNTAERPGGVHVIPARDTQALVDALRLVVEGGRTDGNRDDGRENTNAVLALYDSLTT